MKGGKLVVTLERLSVALASIGNVLAHRLFSHLIRPPEGEERNTGRKWNEESREGGGGGQEKKEERKHLVFTAKVWPHGDSAGGLVDLDHCVFRGAFADLSGNSGPHIVS